MMMTYLTWCIKIHVSFPYSIDFTIDSVFGDMSLGPSIFPSIVIVSFFLFDGNFVGSKVVVMIVVIVVVVVVVGNDDHGCR